MQNLLFCQPANEGDYWKPNAVKGVYMIADGYKTNLSIRPPMVTKVVYHNIGKDKEYCGIIVHEDQHKDGKYVATYIAEYKIPDNIANTLLAFITDNSKFKNKTPIGYAETNDTKCLFPYYYNKYTGEKM